MLDSLPKLSRRDYHTATPDSLKRGEAFSVQLVATALAKNQWTCKAGDSAWSVESVALHGTTVTYEEAAFYHYLMRKREYTDG